MAEPKTSENVINQKDLVLIYLDTKRQFLIEMRKGAKVSSDLGTMNLDDIIGKSFGSIGHTHLGKEYYCLKPSTADLMLKVKRTTTVVYPKDLGSVLVETTIGPGSRVIEVGTGSGALTLVLAKFVAPTGMVYSYERRENFLENAKKNIEHAGYTKNAEFHLRDVAQEGFVEKNVDAVFIDVAEPWMIIRQASEALKGGHHVVSWSPNIEQVKSTVEALKELDFKRIKVSEIIEREMLVRQQGVRPRERGITHTAYLVRGQKVLISDSNEKL